MRKGCDQEEEWKKIKQGKNNGENSGPLVLLRGDRLNCDRLQYRPVVPKLILES